MKKITTLLMVLFLSLALTGCQKKITATVGVYDTDSSAGMMCEMKQGSTVKDLLDEYVKGAEAQDSSFSYELDEKGHLLSINGKANDDNGHWQLTINGTISDEALDAIVLNDEDKCEFGYIQTLTGPVLGGWQVGEVARTDLDDHEQLLYDQAMEGLVGVGYEPVCVLATQLVNGTNYAYLARGTTVTAEPVSGFYIIKIHEDLDGNVEMPSIEQIEIPGVNTLEDDNGQLLGGWTVKGTGRPGTLGSEEVQASFDKIASELTGVAYNPIQLLASQLVNGSNYLALVRGRVTGSDVEELYVASWHVDLDGNSTLTDIRKFDLNSYLD